MFQPCVRRKNVTGDIDKSNRIGVGGEVLFAKVWSIGGEISDGATGVGGRILFGEDKGEERTSTSATRSAPTTRLRMWS